MKTPNGTVLLPPEERGRGEAKGVDLELSRRPGYSALRGIRPFPHAKWPVAQQHRRVKVFMHGRPNKTFPPVFGTDVPPRGLSGAIRAYAYRYPDHMMRHHMVRLFADRVDSWEYHAKKLLPVLIPALASAAFVRFLRARRLDTASELDVERRVEFVPEDGDLDVGEIATDSADYSRDEDRRREGESLTFAPDTIQG